MGSSVVPLVCFVAILSAWQQQLRTQPVCLLSVMTDTSPLWSGEQNTMIPGCKCAGCSGCVSASGNVCLLLALCSAHTGKQLARQQSQV